VLKKYFCGEYLNRTIKIKEEEEKTARRGA
jgi:hypothetical protein